MTPFKNRIVVQIFVIIYIMVNIVHANHEEVQKCLRQIKIAFGYNISATECLKYAIQHYTENQRFPYPNENLFNEIQIVANSKEVAESSRNSQSISDVLEPDNVTNETQNGANSNQSASVEKQNANDKTQKVAKPRIQVFSFEDLISSRPTENTQIEQVNDDSGEIENVANRSQNISTQQQAVTTQQQNFTNYAELYHKALFSMIHGSGVPNRNDFCNHYFPNEYHRCKRAVISFGNTSISAVERAYSSYRLADCKIYAQSEYRFVFIQQYIEVILERCIAKSSKRPLKFCEDLLEK